jgi:hypothetical protein
MALGASMGWIDTIGMGYRPLMIADQQCAIH